MRQQINKLKLAVFMRYFTLFMFLFVADDKKNGNPNVMQPEF